MGTQRRSWDLWLRVPVTAALFFVAYHVSQTALEDFRRSAPDSGDDSTKLMRRRLADDDCYPYAFSNSLLLIPAIMGILYCFLALAIVCDEFFVSALEIMSEQMELSNDIAGATLMAAGGSAPELFTAFIGTFRQSDVGFGTIVGSAVFNVLFVIGCCAMASERPLELTWWPLFRDCSYYTLGLCLLGLFFSGPWSNQQIEWWEAMILFILYIGYCVFMKYNASVYQWIALRILHIDPRFHPVVGESNHRSSLIMHDPYQMLNDRRNFRIGLQRFMVTGEIRCTAKERAIIFGLMGNVEESFNAIDENADGVLQQSEILTLMRNMGIPNAEDAAEKLYQNMREGGESTKEGIDLEQFTAWYMHSEDIILSECKKLFDSYDADNSKTLTADEMRKFLKDINLNEEQMDEAIATMINYAHSDDPNMKYSKDDAAEKEAVVMNFDQFSEWYATSGLLHKHQDIHNKAMAEGEQGLDSALRFPTGVGCGAQIYWIISAPLLYAFYYSMPDCQKTTNRKYATVCFGLSILWIGIVSYAMVELTMGVGDTLGIPSVIMGLTFLAAGTSAPDLISSVVVAKQGAGDMAVSSSIGSNIFDILVGLPLPWMCFAAVYGTPVSVKAKSIAVSIFILVGMLVIVITTIACSDWKLTKTLGKVMFVFYVLFVVQDLCSTYLIYGVDC